MSDTFDHTDLLKLQRDTFGYYVRETNPANGMVPDSTRKGAPASIAAIGLGLAAYPVAVARGFVSRPEAIDRVLTTLRFFWKSRQGADSEAIGYKGFFYHYLDMESGLRTNHSEISTIDTTYVLAGALTCRAFFDRDTDQEREIRDLALELYARADWQWALNEGDTVAHAWKPERGFSRYRWEGYSEALILYVLALASPTYPIAPNSYSVWASTYRWKKLYGFEFLYAGPLFIHQLSHIWIDFREIQDEYMRTKGIDYFENSRRATYVQQHYALRNPRKFRGYNEHSWGITASDGPGPATRVVDGVSRKFFDYCARGVPHGPDDGTLAPWGVVASLPFAPEIVLPTIAYLDEKYPYIISEYGFRCSYNPTFSDASGKGKGWIAQGYYGLDQGPIVMMIENHISGLLWTLMRSCSYIVGGLQRAGFAGGWLAK
ncbi:MAG TPA: glucoamylase family protein [Acidimicrobiia bacterium]|nr:glucoamylase family protein [Acidimicrobiia bacterium]